MGVIDIAHSRVLVTDAHQSGPASREGDAEKSLYSRPRSSRAVLGHEGESLFLSET